MNTSVRIGLIGLVIVAVLGVPNRAYVAPDRQEVVPPKPTGAQEVDVVAVMVDQSTQQPTVLLQGKRDKRSVALAIGLAEATGIAVPLQGVTPPRPLTHDLFLTLFGRLKVTLTRVVITDLRDDIFYAIVYLRSKSASSTRPAAARRCAARRSDAMAEPERTEKEWALQRRLEDVFVKLGEKYGDLTGRVETKIKSTITFDDVGGLRQAKTVLKGFALALTEPDLYRQWGVEPPKGMLLYGPPGTGKSKLAQALATTSGAIFYHLKLMNLTSKFAANTGDLLQEILKIAMAEGPAVLFLDEAEALSLEHLLPPPQAREASARLVAALCEKLDAMSTTERILVVASTTHTDALDPALVAPGRLDHLVEIPLPDPAAQREILELIRLRTEKTAGRPLFEKIDYDKILPVMGGMSGADLSVIVRRALEVKVRAAAERPGVSAVSTEDLLDAIDSYKGVRGVVEKIRYGQYL